MSGKWLVIIGLAVAALLVALAGVERMASRHPSAAAPVHAVQTPETSLPTAAEIEADPSASPALTR